MDLHIYQYISPSSPTTFAERVEAISFILLTTLSSSPAPETLIRPLLYLNGT